MNIRTEIKSAQTGLTLLTANGKSSRKNCSGAIMLVALHGQDWSPTKKLLIIIN